MRLIKIVCFYLVLASYGLAYLGPANSNFVDEGRLLETDYRLGVHIPQQANNDVVIAVIGTGIYKDHEAFQSANFVGAYDFETGENVTTLYSDHETMVAGTIVSNSIENGLRGVNPDAQILDLDIQDSSGTLQQSYIAEAIRYAADNISGKCIINMSLGVPNTGGLITQAIDYANNKGCMLLTAAGNTGLKSIAFPENYPNSGVVSVTGLNSDETERDSVASVADTLKYAAPFDVYSTTSYNSKYRDLTGTSFSCPIISGLASLIWGNDPSLTVTDVYSKLDAHGELILNDPIATTDFRKINVRSLVESYVDLHEKVVETDIDGDGFVEQLYLEISTDKTTGQFLKGYLTHILDDDGTKISVFQEL